MFPLRVSAGVELRVVDDFAALEARKAEWNALVQRSVTNTVFQTFDFHAAWWSVFGGAGRAYVVLAESQGELVGVAPLMISEHRAFGIRRRIMHFIGTRSFDYCDFIVDASHEDVLDVMLSRIAGDRRLFDRLVLRDVPNTSPTIQKVSAYFAGLGLPVDARELYEAPTRLFNDPAADRELPQKKSLKRHYNYFKRSGVLEFRNCRHAAEVASYLDVFFEQHVRRRAVTDAPSLFVDERMRSFFRALAQRGAAEGWLLFSVVLFDAKPIAMHFGFEYAGCITWYKPAFDMEFARHSPGEVLIKYLFEYALERKVKELDFTIGEESFKYRFANHTRANWTVHVYGSRASYYAGRVATAVTDVVKRTPALRRAATQILGPMRNQPWI